MLDKQLLNKYAQLLVDYCVNVKKNEQIAIQGGIAAAPLIEKIYIEVLKRGAFPFNRITLNNQSELFFKYAQDQHLTMLPKLPLLEAKEFDATIILYSETNTKSLSNIEPTKQSQFRKTYKPVSDIRLKKDRWVLALYPTEAYSQDAEMSLSEFEDFVVNAVKINKPNPIKEWQALERYQQKIVDKLKNADIVRIVGKETDLTLSVKNRKFINSCGKSNMPSGEVFTGPLENSANGKIYFEFPVCTSGNEISGIRLEFKDGKVIKASAEKNENYLLKILETDKGARYLGEFAIGLNYS
ncbi:MAG TPA: aminopeptidase, partial [bacterium]|nr:aminopeptidase [bacterium]